MTNETDPHHVGMDGYKPLEKGYQGTGGNPQGGHKPATSEGKPSGPPPNQGTSGKPTK